jgi:hypothetical protein
VTQINAAQAALDKVGLGLLDGHVRHLPRRRPRRFKRPSRAGQGADGRRRPHDLPIEGVLSGRVVRSSTC